MSLFSLFRPKEATTSASVAKDRLKITLAHERSGGTASADFLPKLRKEILDVVSRYVNISPEHIQLTQERQGTLDVLEVKVELPPPEQELAASDSSPFEQSA